MELILHILVLLILSVETKDNICRNNNGKFTDWYFIYLLPKMKEDINKIYYLYFDSEEEKFKKFVYEDKSFPPNKINEYIINDNDINYFVWNDDPTRKDEKKRIGPKSKAHSKGILIYNEKNGLFLIHSLPKFPTRTKNNFIINELPQNSGIYAQVFLCVSINKKYAELIVKILNCINVLINKSISYDKVNQFPNFSILNLINDSGDTYCLIDKIINITSINGKLFTFIIKDNNNNDNIYDSILRKLYKDNFLVRTWSRPKLLPPLKDEFFIKNILEIKFANIKLGKNNDHSKWAISLNKKIVCVGDLNHCESQNVRTGNIICFENDILNDFLKKSIIKTD